MTNDEGPDGGSNIPVDSAFVQIPMKEFGTWAVLLTRCVNEMLSASAYLTADDKFGAANRLIEAQVHMTAIMALLRKRFDAESGDAGK